MAVIDELIIKENGENKIVDSANNKTIDEININGVNYHFAKESESIGTCENAVEEPIIDLKISGNSVQDGTPTPETPIEIESVGEKTINLFDINKVQSIGGGVVEHNGITCYHFKDNSDWFIYEVDNIEVNSVFTFKYYRDASFNRGFNMVYTFEDGTTKVGAYEPNTLYTEKFTKKLIKINASTNHSQNAYLDLTVTQLENGTEATEYEPYGYRVPVKVVGKNLFDGQTDLSFSGGGTPSIRNVSQTSPATYNKYEGCAFAFNVVGGKTYTISGNFNASANGRLVLCYRNDRYTSGEVSNWTVMLPCTVTVPEDKDWIVIAYWSDVANNVVSWSNIQCEEGENATEYVEPFTTTNIYLNEPLRKIGDYADILDYKNKKVVRKIVEKVFDGTETLNKLAAVPAGTFNYTTYTLGEINSVVSDINLCNMLTHSKTFSYTTDEHNVMRVLNANSYNDARFVFRFHINGQNVFEPSTVKTLLSEYYSSGTPLKLYYAPATPTEETIEIPEISTFKGTTVFDSETKIKPSEIKINYWKQI